MRGVSSVNLLCRRDLLSFFCFMHTDSFCKFEGSKKCTCLCVANTFYFTKHLMFSLSEALKRIVLDHALRKKEYVLFFCSVAKKDCDEFSISEYVWSLLQQFLPWAFCRRQIFYRGKHSLRCHGTKTCSDFFKRAAR